MKPPIRQVIVTYEGVYPDGSLMLPGRWIETWIRMAGTGAWFLLGREQLKDSAA